MLVPLLTFPWVRGRAHYTEMRQCEYHRAAAKRPAEQIEYRRAAASASPRRFRQTAIAHVAIADVPDLTSGGRIDDADVDHAVR